tara:strand:+ start:118 stop:882 length:765 start_codon:yes stop_codon:yes gene_type:complete
MKMKKLNNDFELKLVKMDKVKFNKNLFIPMKTGKSVDRLLSSERGLMKGTNTAIIGDPGIGKSTVTLDILADLYIRGNKVLFISGEMTSIDMHGYVKRYPKFGKLPILFLGEYLDADPLEVMERALSAGYDAVLIDSMAEVCVAVSDYHKVNGKKAESLILNMLEKHNKGNNKGKHNTSFIIIQQVTKSGNFAGSNRFKHSLTAMGALRFDEGGGRYLSFDKNRRGGDMNRLYFNLNADNNVTWMYTEANNSPM